MLTRSNTRPSRLPWLQISNIVALIVTIVMNALSNALPFNNLSTGEISGRFPTRFTPAGYVFSIWGLIYLGLIVFVIYQALPAQRDNPRLRALGYSFVLSCVFNIAWLFAWHYLAISLSPFILIALLLTLMVIYRRLRIGEERLPLGEAAALHWPFQIYLGWASVAVVANISIALYNLGWQANAELWASVAIVVASAIGLTMLWRKADKLFSGVLLWAFIGIAVAQSDAPLVVTVALVAALVLVVAVVLHTLKYRRGAAV